MENLILKVDSDYYQSQKNEAGESSGGWHSQMLAAIEEATKTLDKSSFIVDIGCYKGYGLLHLKSLGFTNLVGVDLIKENIDFLLGNNISGYCVDMHDLTCFSKKQFDFAFLSHSIEHSVDPKKVLLEVDRISNKGLIIFPIERNSTKRCNPPHYYTFKNLEDVVEVIPFSSYRLESKTRLGEEIWCWFGI